ncbi:DUF308 domain-containing protein [Devosia rhodophyticola]|uniref:DUF308 domain-containing protein n=1 Tax=Devosia rhodophyticola TaxID=3026423 RepID=A0ABY7YV81_9HYPH|nr:DUF308 domain-containing protein [Devosia rhodophyticola]WDR05164.1 DUF308 domain-containing protein [Devosia rhodophyticola]
MAVSTETKRRFAAATALRGVLMLLAGLYTLIWPGQALTVLVLFGGILLIVDGVLGLWSLTFGGGKSGNYWFDVVANALSLILGILIFISPLIATILTASLLATLVGIVALGVGIMQMVVVVRERALYAHIWPVILSGVSYVVIGLVFLFFPLVSTTVMVMFGGIMLIVLSLGLFGWAWKLYQRTRSA